MKANPWRAIVAVTALFCAGCALTSKGDSLNFRYFTPEGAPARAAPVLAKVDGQKLDLRLGKVDAASYIKDRIAFRASEYEIGFYDDLRWTEKPEAYVRRALVRSLFDENGIRQVVSGNGFVLDVELDAFEEMRAPRHAAYVRLTWVLHGMQAVVLQRTVTIEHALSSSTGEAVSAGLSDALREAIRAMVSDVVAELAKNAAADSAKGSADVGP